MNRRKLISLSQKEIIGFDDEYININVTKFKKYFYCLLASMGYMLAGFFVGWSSKLLILHERPSEFNNLSRGQISWVVSAFALGVVAISLVLPRIYYSIGPKLLLMGASLIIIIAWILNVLFDGVNLNLLLASRFVGGCGSGVIFVILPIYMGEIGGLQYNRLIVDLLTTQFGLGICIHYFMDTMSSFHLSITSVGFALLYFAVCCLLPESPRYQHSRERSRDVEKDDVKLRHLWNEEDLQRKSITDLLVELRKLNLSSLIGLILVEQFIGGISILFYIKYFAQLTGGALSSEWIARTVGIALVVSIPVAKLTKFASIRSVKRQIVISSCVIIVSMLSMAVLCITEGITGRRMSHPVRSFLPLPIFALVTFFYVAGVSRNLWLMVQHAVSSFSLQLHMRALSTAVTWLVIFAITRTLPQLLYLVGVGYFYAYSVIFMVIALIYLNKIVPSTFGVDGDDGEALPSASSESCASSQTHSPHSSRDEMQEI